MIRDVSANRHNIPLPVECYIYSLQLAKRPSAALMAIRWRIVLLIISKVPILLNTASNPSNSIRCYYYILHRIVTTSPEHGRLRHHELVQYFDSKLSQS